jgi:hypothetical protein
MPIPVASWLLPWALCGTLLAASPTTADDVTSRPPPTIGLALGSGGAAGCRLY